MDKDMYFAQLCIYPPFIRGQRVRGNVVTFPNHSSQTRVAYTGNQHGDHESDRITREESLTVVAVVIFDLSLSGLGLSLHRLHEVPWIVGLDYLLFGC